MDVADERLLAVVDHLHGALGPEREQRRVDLHREVLATPERAADAGEVDAHLLRREIEAGRDLLAIDVEPLRRHVDVDAALAVRDRDPRLRAEEGLILLPDLVEARDHDVPTRLRVAALDHHRADDVRPRVFAVAMTHRRAVGMERLHLRRPLGVDHRLERLVLDADGSGCAARLLGLLGSDDCHRLAVVADAVAREDRLVGELEPVGLPAGDVVLRQHRVDTWQRERLGDVDLEDPSVRMRAADGPPPEHPRLVQVARVRELARDLRDRVGAPRGVVARPLRSVRAATLNRPPPRGPHRGSSGTRCSGRGCRRAPRGSRRRSGPGRGAGGRPRRRRTRECRSRTGPRPSRRRRLCTRWSSPSPARPSTVTTSCPSACAASTRHEQTSSPSRSTEHEPHSPCSQAFFEPGSSQPVAQRREQALAGPGVGLARLAVDGELDPHPTSAPRVEAPQVTTCNLLLDAPQNVKATEGPALVTTCNLRAVTPGTARAHAR